jgi:potassium voltage-gated channel Eag-related subfamily H protein 7
MFSKEPSRVIVPDGQADERPPPQVARSASVLFGETETLMGANAQGLLTGFQTSSKFILNPTSPTFIRWQAVIAGLLCFTAIVTPFEVAFLETKIDGLFWVNRVVDLCFVVDMLIVFFMPHQVQTSDGIRWIVKHKDLAANYMKTWFFIDLIAIFPFDIITVSSSSDTSNLKVLRIIRCARLVKLIKLGKGSAVLKSFIRNNGIRNSTLQLLKFAVLIGCANHWLACLWMLVPKLEESKVDWVTKYYGVSKLDGVYGTLTEDEDGNETDFVVDPLYQSSMRMYVTCAYWAMMTLSTIGYGDVTPNTQMELMTGIIGMGVGASLYAYAVGGICGILSNRDPISSAFHDSLECLQSLTREYHLPLSFKRELNDFVWRSNFLFRERSYRDFYHLLSPGLRDFLVSYLHRDWIQKVALFQKLPSAQRGRFLARIAMAMDSKAYPANEVLVRPGDPLEAMAIVKYGILTKTMSSMTSMLAKVLSL